MVYREIAMWEVVEAVPKPSVAFLATLGLTWTFMGWGSHGSRHRSGHRKR